MSIWNKQKSKAAYQGRLTCPVCHSEAIRYVEHITPMRLRYRCRACGLPFQYDISNRFDIHPYAAFNKGKFRGIVDRYHHAKIAGQGRKLK